jgi:hypothetical protein
MQQLSFLEDPPPAGVAPVWGALSEEQRSEAVRLLARLIAKAVVDQEEDHQPEDRHEQ